MIKKKLAIIVLSLGYRPFSSETVPTIASYAEKINAELLLERGFSLDWKIRLRLKMARRGRGNLAAYVQKMISIGRALREFDRVLLLDDSCVINPRAPDIFSLVQLGSIAAYPESENPAWLAPKIDCKFIREKRGVEISEYFNTGVLLVDAAFQDVFSIGNVVAELDLFESSYPDQSYLNYMIKKRHIDVFKLSNKWNFMPIENYADSQKRDLASLPADFLQEVLVKNIVHVTGYYRNREKIIGQVANAWGRSTA